MRCMRLAAKFNLPVLCLSILRARTLALRLKSGDKAGRSPIISGKWPAFRPRSSWFSLEKGVPAAHWASASAMSIGMLQHAYYSVISPEGCASILMERHSKNEIAAEALKMHAEDLLELGIIDDDDRRASGRGPPRSSVVYAYVKKYILDQWNVLKNSPIETLIEQRYQKFRQMGKFASLRRI